MPRDKHCLKLNAAVARARHATPEPEALEESHESTCPALRALRALLNLKERQWACESEHARPNV